MLGTEDPTRSTGTRYFFDLDIYNGKLPPNDNLGGINILNIPGDEWSLTVNMQWLQNAIDRNDVIRIISDPLENCTIWKNGIPPGMPGYNGRKTVVAKEIDYLVARGYVYDPYLPGYVKL